MNSTLVTVSVTLTLLLATWAGGLAVWGRPAGRALLAGIAVAQVLVMAQAGFAVVRLAGGGGAIAGAGEVVTFTAYLAGSLVVLPIAGVWARAEPTRWGAAVLAVAALTTTVIVARLQAIWLGTGA